MNKKIVLVTLMMTILISSVFANSEGGKEMIWKLDLTKEQREKISAKENVMEIEVLQLRQSIRSLRAELNEQLSSNEPDKTKVELLISESSDKMTKIQIKTVDFMLWMREQLSPEQKQKLLALMKTRELSQGSKEAENK